MVKWTRVKRMWRNLRRQITYAWNVLTSNEGIDVYHDDR